MEKVSRGKPSSAFAVACLAVTAAFVVWAQGISTERDYRLAWFVGILLAISFGCVAGWKAKDFSSAKPHPTRFWKVLAVSVGGALFCGIFVWFCGHRQFGGFDHSVLIDTGWRLLQGQQPYEDFPCTMPIGFVLGAGYAFRLFGLSWSAIIAFEAGFAALTFLWSLILLRQLTERLWLATALALACQAMANLLTSYWWYNAATTTAAVVFFLSALLFSREPQGVLANVSYAASLVLLAAMKPNIAGVLIGGVTVVLLTSRAHRWRVLILSSVAFGGFAAWLGLHGLTVREVVESYLSISGRGLSGEQFLQDMRRREKAASLLALASLLAPWLLFVRAGLLHEAVRKRSFWLAMAAVAAGGFGFLTNGESKLVDLPLLLLALWWMHDEFLRAFGSQGAPAWLRGGLRWVIAVAVTLALTGATAGLLRHRVRGIGPGFFFEFARAAASPQTMFFRKTETGARFLQTEAEVLRALQQYAPARVFFGPRMQWGYAAFRQPSPLSQPIWWHPGVAYPWVQEDAWVARWADTHHDLLVFAKADFTYLPHSMLQIIARNYELQRGWQEITVFTPAAPRAAARTLAPQQ
jgi:hypothetical protein